MSGFLTALIAAVMTTLSPVALPPAGGTADYQLGGTYAPAPDVTIVTRDRTEQPATGLYSICYVNSFQTQPGDLPWWRAEHPGLLLRDATGRLVRDAGWPDEVLLDIRTPAKRAEVAAVNREWFDQCASDGFQAVEPDNLDSWTRSGGLLTKSQTVGMAKLLVAEAHVARLAIAQKNTADLSRAGIDFDFAVAEECEVYRECGEYMSTYGRHLIEVEYTDNGRTAFARACAARSGKASIMLRDRDLVAAGRPGHTARTC